MKINKKSESIKNIKSFKPEQLEWIGKVAFFFYTSNIEAFTARMKIATGLLSLYNDRNGEVLLSYADMARLFDVSLPMVSKTLVGLREEGFINSYRKDETSSIPYSHTINFDLTSKISEDLTYDEMQWFSSAVFHSSVTSSCSSQKVKVFLALIDMARRRKRFSFKIRDLSEKIGVSSKTIVATLYHLVSINCLKRINKMLDDGRESLRSTPSYLLNIKCVKTCSK